MIETGLSDFHKMTVTVMKKSYEKLKPRTIIYLKTRHIFKSCNIYLKPERFRKSKFILSKVKSF